MLTVFNVSFSQLADLRIKYVDLEQSENLESHRTNGFRNTKSLVVRRGAPFKVSVQLEGQPFNPKINTLRVKIMLGFCLCNLYAVMPVTFSKSSSKSSWNAYIDPEEWNPLKPSIYIYSPASASVGSYRFQLCVLTQDGKKSSAYGNFILLCNPWCSEDTVYIPFEDQREEYIQSDFGLLFMGSGTNIVERPWSFDLYESGVLEACLNLLQVSPQHKKNRKMDYLNRNNPVYLSRVVSAMINSEDDRGVLKGNWTGDFKQGVSPSMWTGSGDILRKWNQSGNSPVKYGQCWVFAAVMCTVMRVLGIPCRVITNFNSAHDTDGNLVIEEYYSATGQKLNLTKDSIWNFHVWVECWMTRRDLESGMDGWQVLDPTPQQRSGGVYRCGPAPVKAIKNKRVDLFYDVPFVYASVNADIHTIILGQGQVLGFSKDTERVGSLICTKAVGFPRLQKITGDYKYIKRLFHVYSAGSSQGVLVFLTLDKSPIVGEPVSFSVKIMNKQNVAKMTVVAEDPLAQYEDVVGDNLINLAVVVEDTASQERVLSSEEFNITSPQLIIQVADEKSIKQHSKQTALVTFINPYSHPVSGVLTVAGAGLLQGKVQFRVDQPIPFMPNMVGEKMLQASLWLTNMNVTIRGFKMVSVNSV
uniref:protein-glutamine gamma-glutamyltransferase n=1 Tax=Maylandia zebra TaxID=106582 RepID=A0A3P9B9B2_9CICH